MPPAVEFLGVSKRYGRGDTPQILSDLRLAVSPGERLLILGPSGSGKTTLLNLAAAIDQPDEGEVRIQGQNISSMSESRRARFRSRHIGFIFQHHLLPKGLTALQAVATPLLWSSGASPREASARAMEILEKVELSAVARRRVETLSGGQRQRVAIARAIVTEPSIVLADEPTAQLDRPTSERITAWLREWISTHDATLIAVSHEAGEANLGTSRRLFLRDGVLEK